MLSEVMVTLVGDTGTKILGRQGGAPDQFQTEKKQGVVVCLENAGTFTEIKDVQGAVTGQRHGEIQIEGSRGARYVTLM